MRTPTIRTHRAKGRSAWFTIRVGGRDVHLGTDFKAACKRAGELMDTAGIAPNAPDSVAGLVNIWNREHPTTRHAMTAWARLQREKLLSELTDQDLAAFVEDLKTRLKPNKKRYTSNSVRTYSVAVLGALKAARKRGWLRQTFERPEIPASTRNPHDISDEDLAAGFESMRPWTRRIVTFALATGARPGEVCGLKWGMVRLDQKLCQLTEHKTAESSGRPRVIYLTPEAETVLRSIPRRGPEAHVFLNKNGEPYSTDALYTIARRRNWKGGAYSWRHSFAQRVSEQVPVQDLAKLLGHTSVRTSSYYYEVKSARAKEVAAMVTLPALPRM